MNKLLLSAFLATILISGLLLVTAMHFGTIRAYTVDSIGKPSIPEFSVRTVAYPYDVPPKTATTIDQYTGEETTTTQPGYHVENKSIEITIKNPQFTPYDLTTHTVYNHETGESRTSDSNITVNLYYKLEVRGHFGDDWKSIESNGFTYESRQSNVQLDSEYTIFTIKTDDYPEDAVLDFRVKTLIGIYILSF